MFSPAVVITDEKNNNPRSSLGTVTDIYTDIRMIYEKLGVRKCPHCGKMIDASYCHEERVISRLIMILLFICTVIIVIIRWKN